MPPATDPRLCVQPGKRDECVYEVCLPPEDPASGGEEESEDGEHLIAKRVGTMVKIFHFVMKQSYICALIAMMVSSAARSGGNLSPGHTAWGVTNGHAVTQP